MIRKLVLPALAAALLAGCVTDYGAYGGGVYGGYYGNPSVEFRYDSGYLMYPSGYGGYGTYCYPYRYYGAPYGYGGYGGYYGYPYYRPSYPYYRPYQGHRPPGVHPRPHGPYPPQHRRDDDRRPPWRNYDELRRRPMPDGGGAAAQSRAPMPVAPLAEPRERGGSRMEQTVRRANRNADTRVDEQEP